MEMVVDRIESHVSVAILRLSGDSDGSNYKDVIAKSQELHDDGIRYLLLDMENIRYMGSAGLIALHRIVLMMQGDEVPGEEAGWEAIHALDRVRDDDKQDRVKLLNPRPNVIRVLATTGLKDFFESYTDQDAAIASF
jgi:anti-anti-sigma factor